MNISDGRLSFTTNINNSQLRADAAESRNILHSIGQTAIQESETIDGAFSKIAKAASGVFALDQAKDFARQIISVRAEIQSLEISFETLLGSKNKADALFGSIRQFATQTPMMLKDLAAGAQTMLGFGIETEKVMPMLKAIGDVSMGDAAKFNSLALAFSQASATGKLMGQDLMQMINAGFNPLSAISEKTGKSIKELKDEVESGSFSIQMLEDAFITATSAGGKYYGMLEKQSHGMAGAISNLQGAIDDMYNSLGEASQGAVTSVINGASTLVKNYEKVAEVLAIIIGFYGSYKAALIATEAVRKSVTKIKHTEEAASLYGLMTAEQKAKISKLGLAESSEAYRAAIVSEMEGEMERQIQLAQSSQIELTAIRERLAAAEAEKIAASEKIALRESELASAIEAAGVEHSASITKQIDLEREAQSRAALLALKLQEQKNKAIAEVKALKEAKAEEEVIAAKNRQIATVSKKLAAAKAEEIQHGQNVIALRKELTAEADLSASKAVVKAETALATAQEELNTASTNRNTLALQAQSKAAAVNTHAKKANTIETALDTTAQEAENMAVGKGAVANTWLTAAKERLTIAAQKLNAAILENPYVLAAAAVVALGVAIYSLVTYESEAEKAHKRLKDASAECEASFAAENIKIKEMFDRLKEAKEGTDEYKAAKEAIISQYGTYLEGLSSEIASLKDVTAAYNAVRDAALEAARARSMEAYLEKEGEKYSENWKAEKDRLDKILKDKMGEKWVKDHADEIAAVARGERKWTKAFADKFVEDEVQGSGRHLKVKKVNPLLNSTETIRNLDRQYEETRKNAAHEFGVNLKKDDGNKKPDNKEKYQEGAANARKKHAEEKAKLKKMESDKSSTTEEVKNQRKIVENLEKKLKDDYDIDLKEEARNAKSAAKADARNARNAAKDADKAENVTKENNDILAKEAAERLKKSEEYARKIADQKKDEEFEIQQAGIDAMEEGVDKELKQNELNYERRKEEIKRKERELLDEAAEVKLREKEDADPTMFKKKDKNGKLVDDPGKRDEELRKIRAEITVEDLDPDQKKRLEEFGNLATKSFEKGNQDILKKMLQDVRTYQQQRQDVEEEYAKKREQLYEKDAKGKVQKDKDGDPVLRKGATQGNIDELNRQQQEALNAIDEQFAQREESYQAWCEMIAGYSLESLQSALADAEAQLEALKKNGTKDAQQLAQAYAKVTKLRKQIKTEQTKLDLNPKQKTIKEWEELYKSLSDIEKEFESMGDTVGGVVGDIISECGKMTTSTLSMINGIVQLAKWASISMKMTAEGASKSMQMMEKASVIITIISAALQIAMQIANLFNSDNKKQKEIDALQSRIEQLEWELDHADIGKMTKEYGSAIERLNKALYLSRVELGKGLSTWDKLVLSASKASQNTELMEKSAEKLAKIYAQISYTADKALGEEKYKGATDKLKNLAQQQILIQEQLNEESKKKKSDDSAIDSYRRKIEELGQEMLEVINELVEDIIGDTSSGIANQLADAFFDAFKAGEDAAKAWSDKVNDIVADIMKRMMIQKFLEEPLGKIFDKYKEKWFPGGEFQGLDAIKDSMGAFAADLNGTFSNFNAAMAEMPEDIKNMILGDAGREASQKGIAAASQDSIDELNGRITAIQSHTFSLNETNKLLLSATQSILKSVMSIEDETAGLENRMARMENHIKEMNDSLDIISSKGVRIRN